MVTHTDTEAIGRTLSGGDEFQQGGLLSRESERAVVPGRANHPAPAEGPAEPGRFPPLADQEQRLSLGERLQKAGLLLLLVGAAGRGRGWGLGDGVSRTSNSSTPRSR